MTYIYDNELELIEKLNYNLEKFKENPVAIFPDWQENYMTSEKEYLEPNLIKVVSGEIVEKTLEELKVEGLKPLEDGEIIIDNKIISIAKPDGFLTYVFNRETNEWVEGSTIEEVTKKYLEIVEKYKQKAIKEGHEWVDKDGNAHMQPFNTEVEARFNTVKSSIQDLDKYRASGIDIPEQSTNWVFSDTDIYRISETEFNQLFSANTVHLDRIYDIASELATKEPNLLLTYDEFKLTITKLLQSSSISRTNTNDLFSTLEKLNKK